MNGRSSSLLNSGTISNRVVSVHNLNLLKKKCGCNGHSSSCSCDNNSIYTKALREKKGSSPPTFQTRKIKSKINIQNALFDPSTMKLTINFLQNPLYAANESGYEEPYDLTFEAATADRYNRTTEIMDKRPLVGDQFAHYNANDIRKGGEWKNQIDFTIFKELFKQDLIFTTHPMKIGQGNTEHKEFEFVISFYDEEFDSDGNLIEQAHLSNYYVCNNIDEVDHTNGIVIISVKHKRVNNIYPKPPNDSIGEENFIRENGGEIEEDENFSKYKNHDELITNLTAKTDISHKIISKNIRNKTQSHTHTGTMEMSYHTIHNSPWVFSICGLEYYGLDFVVSVLIGVIEAFLAASGDEEFVITEIIFEVAKREFKKLIKDIIRQAIHQQIAKLQDMVLEEINTVKEHLINTMENSTFKKHMESTAQHDESATKNVLTNCVGNISRSMPNTSSTDHHGKPKNHREEVSKHKNFIVNIIYHAAHEIIKWLIKHKVIKAVDIPIIDGIMECMYEVCCSIMDPLGSLPPLASRLITLGDRCCWIADFHGHEPEAYTYSWLQRINHIAFGIEFDLGWNYQCKYGAPCGKHCKTTTYPWRQSKKYDAARRELKHTKVKAPNKNYPSTLVKRWNGYSPRFIQHMVSEEKINPRTAGVSDLLYNNVSNFEKCSSKNRGKTVGESL